MIDIIIDAFKIRIRVSNQSLSPASLSGCGVTVLDAVALYSSLMVFAGGPDEPYIPNIFRDKMSRNRTTYSGVLLRRHIFSVEICWLAWVFIAFNWLVFDYGVLICEMNIYLFCFPMADARCDTKRWPCECAVVAVFCCFFFLSFRSHRPACVCVCVCLGGILKFGVSEFLSVVWCFRQLARVQIYPMCYISHSMPAINKNENIFKMVVEWKWNQLYF